MLLNLYVTWLQSWLLRIVAADQIINHFARNGNLTTKGRNPSSKRLTLRNVQCWIFNCIADFCGPKKKIVDQFACNGNLTVKVGLTRNLRNLKVEFLKSRLQCLNSYFSKWVSINLRYTSSRSALAFDNSLNSLNSPL